MERKIGEIFEFGGEWHQCVEHKGCHSCAFALRRGFGFECVFKGTPRCTCRSDGKLVIFKKLEMEEKKLNLKPFDFQKAREGKPVCTMDGRRARIICFDFRDADEICCIIAAVDYGEAEKIHYYDLYGKYRGGDSSEYDLMMLPEKKERWMNVYHNEKGEYWSEQVLFSTKKEAIDFVHDHAQYVTTVKIEWEE